MTQKWDLFSGQKVSFWIPFGVTSGGDPESHFLAAFELPSPAPRALRTEYKTPLYKTPSDPPKTFQNTRGSRPSGVFKPRFATV